MQLVIDGVPREIPDASARMLLVLADQRPGDTMGDLADRAYPDNWKAYDAFKAMLWRLRKHYPELVSNRTYPGRLPKVLATIVPVEPLPYCAECGQTVWDAP